MSVALSEPLKQRLRCPICGGRIALADDGCRCASCAQTFPILDGVPILLNERASVFTFDDFLQRKKTFFDPAVDRRGWRARLAHALYDNDLDLRTTALLNKFAELLPHAPRVLVIGAGDGRNLAALRSRRIELVQTDVSWTGGLSLICDAHDIPFDDDTFDGAIAQAVLEHVVDPYRCASEIHRVLKSGGIVFAETPFMQQVHAGRYDFTRFTHLGHRRLFRRFEEIESGASVGPGVALIWAWRYFLLAFARSKIASRLLRGLAKATSFWWKHFDRHLLDKPAALDAASAVYFLGRKSDSVLSDRELLRSYRGANEAV